MPSETDRLQPKKRFGHGGRRPGAGRKLAPGKQPSVSHKARPTLQHVRRVHVTVHLRPGIGDLRTPRLHKAVRAALEGGKDRSGLRVLQFCVQRSHVHVIAEAAHRIALSRGIQGLNVRIARGINRILVRKGKVFADRYHARALKTRDDTCAALACMLAPAAGRDRSQQSAWSTIRHDRRAAVPGRLRMSYPNLR